MRGSTLVESLCDGLSMKFLAPALPRSDRMSRRPWTPVFRGPLAVLALAALTAALVGDVVGTGPPEGVVLILAIGAGALSGRFAAIVVPVLVVSVATALIPDRNVDDTVESLAILGTGAGVLAHHVVAVMPGRRSAMRRARTRRPLAGARRHRAW